MFPWLRLVVSMLGCMVFPRLAPLLLLTLLVGRVLVAAALGCHLSRYGRLQTINLLMLIGLIVLFLAAISNGLNEVALR